jgi:hypothetical protein
LSRGHGLRHGCIATYRGQGEGRGFSTREAGVELDFDLPTAGGGGIPDVAYVCGFVVELARDFKYTEAKNSIFFPSFGLSNSNDDNVSESRCCCCIGLLKPRS